MIGTRTLQAIVVAVCFASLGVAPARASASGQPQPSTEQTAAVREGANIRVIGIALQKELRGTLLGLDEANLRILVEEKSLQVPLRDIERIDVEHRDSVKNGLSIGAVALGILCAAVCGQGLDSKSQLVPAIAVNALIGGIVGARIDAAIVSRTRLYP